MEALGGSNWGWDILRRRIKHKHSDSQRRRKSKSSDSVDVTRTTGYQFPLKQALTAGSLALTGDTIAQLTARWRQRVALGEQSVADSGSEYINEIRRQMCITTLALDEIWSILLDHDWLRSLRMTSYGFLFYGPGSYLWYRSLDRFLPKQNVENLMLKVLLNQIVLGPAVIAVVFAWNNLWLGKLAQLPNKYQNDALPTLLYGFRFWIPVSILNFWLIPLQARVAFMSMGSIFWNFYLSSTMSK